jgi:hypothetical protein
MNKEIKRLAIVSVFCFFPTALIGFALLKKSEKTALNLFRASIYIFLGIMSVAGTFVVIKGGEVIKVMVSLY